MYSAAKSARDSVSALGLSPLQAACIVAVYSDGATAEELAARQGVTVRAVRAMLARAGDVLDRRGFPRPRPRLRGSRADVRRFLPANVAEDCTA